MAQLDPVILGEIPVIRKVIQDETWYESERRGCPVPAEDPVVREHVCQVILRIGCELRAALAAKLAENPGPVMLPATGPRSDVTN